MSWFGCWVNLIYIPFCGAKGHSFFTNKFAFLLNKFSFQNKSSLIPIRYTLFLLLTYLDLFYHGEAQVDENIEFHVWTAILNLKLFNVGKMFIISLARIEVVARRVTQLCQLLTLSLHWSY